MLAQCAGFESCGDDASEYANAGTLRHAALSAILANPEADIVGVPDDEHAAIRWAADYIRCAAPMSDHPLELEQSDSFIGPDFKEIQGTPDVTCGGHVFDLKWRWREYDAQMAAYAMMRTRRGWERVTVHMLFGDAMRAVKLEFTEESALAVIEPIITAVNAQSAPTPCDYCGWCSKRVTCPALIERANAVVVGREDWKLTQYHSSEITTADEAGKALTIAKQLEGWCESVKHHVNELALKKGVVATGFELKTRQGRPTITSITGAFERLGLPQEVFLGLCKAPAFSAIIPAYQAAKGMESEAAAKREVMKKLEDITERASSTQFLQAKK
jgi:hypothetical protein